MKYLFFSFLMLFASCSFKKSKLKNQTEKGHKELYSQPAQPEATTDQFKRIIIASTNNIKGHYLAQTITFKDEHNKGNQSIGVGGVDIVSSYFNILREKYDEILLLDSGDLFPQNGNTQKFINQYYSSLKYDAITIGLEDFNFKLPSPFKNSTEFLKNFSNRSKVPLLLSNVYEVKKARVVDWKGTLPYLIKEINGVKIGMIGLVADDIVSKSPVDNRVGLYVEGMLESTLKQARLIRSLGAEIVVIITNQGFSCGEKLASDSNLPLSKVNFEPERSDVCDLNNALGNFLKRLPNDLVDVVIGGQINSKMMNYVNGTLVLSSFPNGQGFSYVELLVNKETNKLDRTRTQTRQPVKFCREFFKETNDCYTEDRSIDHKLRTPALFLDSPIAPDQELLKKFDGYLNPIKKKQTLNKEEIQKTITFHNADLGFIFKGNINSKLIVLELKGQDLIKLLEEEYNQGNQKFWFPMPFQLKDQALSIQINGQSIQANNVYKILANFEDTQTHPRLLKFINYSNAKTLAEYSWNSITETDEVTAGLAAPVHIQ